MCDPGCRRGAVGLASLRTFWVVAWHHTRSLDYLVSCWTTDFIIARAFSLMNPISELESTWVRTPLALKLCQSFGCWSPVMSQRAVAFAAITSSLPFVIQIAFPRNWGIHPKFLWSHIWLRYFFMLLIFPWVWKVWTLKIVPSLKVKASQVNLVLLKGFLKLIFVWPKGGHRGLGPMNPKKSC